MNGKLLQKICFLKNAKKTCKPNNRDLNRDWIRGNHAPFITKDLTELTKKCNHLKGLGFAY